MHSLLLEAIDRRIIAKRMKRRNKKRKSKEKYYAGWSCIPSLLLGAGKRRFIAKCRKTRRRKRRELEKKCSLDWSSLPPAILEMVAEKLTLIDWLSTSKVCRSWNTVLGQELPCWKSYGFPWLLVSHQQNKEIRTCISVLENRVRELELSEAYGKYCWGSFRDWLIMVKVDNLKLEVNLLNPFSRNEISLPSIWNLYQKMVLSGLPSENNFVCMLLHTDYRELAFWVPGAQSWHKLKLTGEPFEDAVFCNGKFYLLGDGCNLWQIDVRSIYCGISEGRDDFGTLSKIETQIQFQERMMLQRNGDNDILRYLVESCGELLLVFRYFSSAFVTQKFEVYSLDYCQSSWKKVEDLGDQMIFLGKCCSRSFSAKELGVGIRNSIYFSNDPAVPWFNEWDSNHFRRVATSLGFNQTERNWGIFRLDYDNGEPFVFHGDMGNWAYTWFTAPVWECCREGVNQSHTSGLE